MVDLEPSGEFGELPGEDLATSSMTEVAGWISVYEELAGVLRAVYWRADASVDVDYLRRNLAWVEGRLEAWRDRHAELAGVAIDRARHSLSYRGRKVRLTGREADLLDFLLRHPGRPFTPEQLATQAWQNSRLSNPQVRTYVMRLRGKLRAVGFDRAITMVRNRGYGIAES